MNSFVGFLQSSASAQVPVINSPNGFTPDWSRLRFSDMIISLSGSVTYPGTRGTETRTWTAGQSISEFMELGDFETPQLAIENLNLSTIASAQGINLSGLTLDDFQLTQWQTLPSLTKAIPGLSNRNVTSVKPVSDFLRRFGITGGTIGNASRNSRLRDVQLGRVINFKNYSLTSISDIQNTSINRFQNWQDSKINGVPGLSTLTWDNLPGLQTLDLSFVAKVDLPLGDIEANRTRSISGSYQDGFNVPCLQNNCAHTEISGIGKTTGTQWISGKFQKVNGGFGILKALNDGQEPTGRNPFGSSFKQVVWNIYEASGKVETTMFFRICKTIPFIGRTCSPYFIGPVPFIEYREKDPIVLGQPNSLP
ncbi:Murein DD-endopeptidase MepM and murein hydrolase activator NlpD, containing LysM domain (plasmid) [Nostoc flagelliforme CCNUN1]|uniref:Murein DD-endopeptidase MepM and murein hydrolase activator NlpD, containing LysM domain n=1 Tax=Nostoc flagelliforme CCNUN1 TaxID=2038116 RepID=A0A2K8T9T9_9NOSO|nr:Murein DD-endopeptidase MepM and murein hydrolase activator NlpD, containing LysM domain [Nostoc flagelliforme CCNUN1]